MKKVGEVFSNAYICTGRRHRPIERIWADLTPAQQGWCTGRDIIIRRAPRGAGQIELFVRDTVSERDSVLLPFIFPTYRR